MIILFFRRVPTSTAIQEPNIKDEGVGTIIIAVALTAHIIVAHFSLQFSSDQAYPNSIVSVTMTSSRFSVLLLLICVSLLPSAFGFASSSSSTRRPSFLPSTASTTTRLQQSSIPQEHGEPLWFELPKPYPSKKREQCAQVIEDVVGRVAMVGALGLMAGEIFTGESVAQQVSDAFSNLGA